MFALHAPLHQARHVRSDDPDEVTSLVLRYDGHHSRVIHGSGRYGFDSAFLAGRLVRIGWGRTALAHTVRGSLQDACIHVSVDTVNRYSFGRRQLEVAPGTLTFIGPGSGFTRHSKAGSMFAMDVDGAALAAEAQARQPGAVLDWVKYPQVLDRLWPEKRAFAGAVADLVSALDGEHLRARLEQCEGRLVSLLAGMLLPSSALIRTAGVAAQRLADLEAWIDAHLGERITLGRLCEVAAVGDRSLHLAFNSLRCLWMCLFQRAESCPVPRAWMAGGRIRRRCASALPVESAFDSRARMSISPSCGNAIPASAKFAGYEDQSRVAHN